MSDEEGMEDNSIKSMFNGIKEYFENETFCDLTIFGQEGDEFRGIKCHTLVICSVASALKHLLIEEDEEKFLFLPEIPFQTVSNFVNDIYNGLLINDFSLNITEELAPVFFPDKILGLNDAYKPKENEKFEIVVEQNNAVKQDPLQLILPDVEDSNMDGTYLVDASNLSEEQQMFAVSFVLLRNGARFFFSSARH